MTFQLSFEYFLNVFYISRGKVLQCLDSLSSSLISQHNLVVGIGGIRVVEQQQQHNGSIGYHRGLPAIPAVGATLRVGKVRQKLF